VSGFVSVMGALLGFITNFVAAFQKRGGTDEQLHELLVGNKSEDFIGQIVDLAMKMIGAVRDGVFIIVDYTRSLAEMIGAGAYYRVNPNITSEHFTIEGKGQGKVELNPEFVHYDKCMKSNGIFRDLDMSGLRPATPPELLAYGEKYPDEQRKYPIVALGSAWRRWFGFRYVVYLYCYKSKRLLDLRTWAGEWDKDCRFLAFRKETS